jgi:hypothetical protein
MMMNRLNKAALYLKFELVYYNKKEWPLKCNSDQLPRGTLNSNSMMREMIRIWITTREYTLMTTTTRSISVPSRAHTSRSKICAEGSLKSSRWGNLSRIRYMEARNLFCSLPNTLAQTSRQPTCSRVPWSLKNLDRCISNRFKAITKRIFFSRINSKITSKHLRFTSWSRETLETLWWMQARIVRWTIEYLLLRAPFLKSNNLQTPAITRRTLIVVSPTTM